MVGISERVLKILMKPDFSNDKLRDIHVFLDQKIGRTRVITTEDLFEDFSTPSREISESSIILPKQSSQQPTNGNITPNVSEMSKPEMIQSSEKNQISTNIKTEANIKQPEKKPGSSLEQIKATIDSAMQRFSQFSDNLKSYSKENSIVKTPISVANQSEQASSGVEDPKYSESSHVINNEETNIFENHVSIDETRNSADNFSLNESSIEFDLESSISEEIPGNDFDTDGLQKETSSITANDEGIEQDEDNNLQDNEIILGNKEKNNSESELISKLVEELKALSLSKNGNLDPQKRNKSKANKMGGNSTKSAVKQHRKKPNTPAFISEANDKSKEKIEKSQEKKGKSKLNNQTMSEMKTKIQSANPSKLTSKLSKIW